MTYDVFIIATLPLLWFALNLFSFIIIFLYELEHALPALLFTRKPVTVYIGTYGDDKGRKLKIGRLTIFIKPKFSYLKQNGVCLYDGNIGFGQQAIILLLPMIMATITIIILFVYVLADDMDTYVRVTIGVASLVTTFNFIINLFPRKLLVKSSKRLYYSDGYQLILWMEDKSNYSNLLNACQLYDEDNYTAALIRLEKIKDKYMEESLFRLMISCYSKLGNFDKIKKLEKKYENAKWNESLEADDYYQFGYADLELKDYKQALLGFDKAISLNPNHFDSRLKRAFVYNALKEYNQAKNDAEKAVFINEKSSEAFSTRAYANFMLGKTGEAFNDADKAEMLDINNAYAYLVIGLYFRDKGNTGKATEYLEHAKFLNPEMLYIDEYLETTKSR
jgi:tetratricopeptide (TPR) repeat protein